MGISLGPIAIEVLLNKIIAHMIAVERAQRYDAIVKIVNAAPFWRVLVALGIGREVEAMVVNRLLEKHPA